MTARKKSHILSFHHQYLDHFNSWGVGDLKAEETEPPPGRSDGSGSQEFQHSHVCPLFDEYDFKTIKITEISERKSILLIVHFCGYVC